MEMEETLENHDLPKLNWEIPIEMAKNVTKVNKCSQCNYESTNKGHLRAHIKAHSGKKCNQCDYATAHASALRAHLKTRSGEKLNQCNQCDFASSDASSLRRHLKTHGENRA